VRAIVALVAVPLLGFVVVREIDGDQAIVWENPVVTVEIQQDGSDDVSDGSDLAAIRDALGAWNAAPCSRFRFVDGGTGTSRGIGRDGVNRLTFIERDWPAYAAGAGAYTVREREAGTPDHWVDFDIQMNGVDVSWATDGPVSRGDIRSAMVHELGHGLGLQHSSDPRATMFFSVRLGTTFARTLHADDIAGVCYDYPAQAFSCAQDTDCPLFYAQYGGQNYRAHCVNNACVEGPASVYGAGCFENDDCATGSCLLDPLNPPSSEAGFCSQTCDAATPCPNGEYCGTTASGLRCIIGRTNCAVDADCGGAPNVCARQLDGRFECQRLCLRDAQCATLAGTVCHGGTGANPAGFCRVPGAGRPGDACESGLDCASLTCTSGGVITTCTAVTTTGEDASVSSPDAAAPVHDDAAVSRRDAGISGRDAAAIPADASAVDASAEDAAMARSAPDAAEPETDRTITGGCTCLVPGQKGSAWATLLILTVMCMVQASYRRPKRG